MQKRLYIGRRSAWWLAYRCHTQCALKGVRECRYSGRKPCKLFFHLTEFIEQKDVCGDSVWPARGLCVFGLTRPSGVAFKMPHEMFHLRRVFFALDTQFSQLRVDVVETNRHFQPRVGHTGDNLKHLGARTTRWSPKNFFFSVCVPRARCTRCAFLLQQ